MSKRLLELARVRTITIEVEGEKFIVREPSALELIARRSRMYITHRSDDGQESHELMPDATERGLAYLIATCVTDVSGSPAWNEQEAYTIATGRQQVALPIINAVSGFLSSEKKV